MAEQASSEHRNGRKDEGAQEDEGGNVEEGSRSLCLSTSTSRTLVDGVTVQVVLVVAAVHVDGGSNGGGGGEGEDEVQEVKDRQQDRPCKGSNEVCEHTIDGGGQNTECCGENGEIHLWVVVVWVGCSKGAG